jgi:hypothetical protein
LKHLLTPTRRNQKGKNARKGAETLRLRKAFFIIFLCALAALREMDKDFTLKRLEFFPDFAVKSGVLERWSSHGFL